MTEPSPPLPDPKIDGRLLPVFKKGEEDVCNKSPVQNYVTSFVELLREIGLDKLPRTFSVTKYFKDGKQAGAAHGLVLELSTNPEVVVGQKISVIEFGSSAIKINPVYTKLDKEGNIKIIDDEVVNICIIKGNIDSEKLKEEFKKNIANGKVQKRLNSSDTKFVIFLSGGHIKKHKDSETATEFVKSCNIPSQKLLKHDIYTQEGLYEAKSALYNMNLDKMLSESTTRLIVTSIGGQTAQTTAISNTDGKWEIKKDDEALTINMEKKKGEAAINDDEKEQLKKIFSSGERDNTQVMFMSTWGFVIRNAYNQALYVTGGPCEKNQKPEWKYKTLDNWDIFSNLLPTYSSMEGMEGMKGANPELREKLEAQRRNIELVQNPSGQGGGKKTRHKNRKNKKRKTKRIRMKMKNRKTKIRKKSSKKYKRQTKKRG